MNGILNIINDKKPRVFLVVVLMTGCLLTGGTVYRVTAVALNRVVKTKITLEKPLDSIPLTIMNWKGEDVPIPVNVQEVAGVDDFLSRLYVNKTDHIWINLYVAYTARPRTMLGHRPQICYPASGWVHDSTVRTEVVTREGRNIPCLLHNFHRTGQEKEERFVLNYYFVNGRLTDDERVFYGLGWRTPNIAGNPARYVAQIQISSVFEGSVLRAAQEMSDLLIKIFPSENEATGKSGDKQALN